MKPIYQAEDTQLNLLCWLFYGIIFISVFNLYTNKCQNLPKTIIEAKTSITVENPAPLAVDKKVDGTKKPTQSKTKKTDKFQTVIQYTAKRYQVDPNLIKAIIMTESSYNPKAVSHRGAKGLMQLMPGTAEELGVKDCFNPENNIEGGVKYFRKLLDRFDGDIKLALAAYNAGSRNVRQYRGVPPFKATHNYIKKVNMYFQLFKDQTAEETSRV